ncbi:MAG TPA: hypothetical protein VGC01_05015 [Mucilaginibacter sp.]
MGLLGRIDFANTHSAPTGPNSEDDYADVYITLIDVDTGQPANGHNAATSYSVNDNGSITTNQITISGQSQLIYSGVVSRMGLNDTGLVDVIYYKSFSIISVVENEDPSPPVNSCDLVINYINIDKAESATGANDAQITIGASSSYLPLRYSINNVSFQASATFTGLSNGVKTVYVTDANPVGCVANRQVNIPVLTNLLVSDPSVTVGGNISRWNAAFNPVVFTYQRKDFEITAITADSLTGNATLTINANLNGVINNDLVYVNAGSYNGVYNVTGVTSNSITINKPYTATATGFININRLKPYYQLQTKITYQDKLLGLQNTIISTNRPDSAGLIKADLANFLQSLLRAKDESDFTQINYRDDNLSASYQIAYAQHWDDGTINGYTSDWIAIANPYYVIYAAKQLGNKYGGNLAAYVPFTSVTDNTQLAKWVTDFTEPAYSNGYPFDIGFIYSEDMVGLDIYCEVGFLDVNRDALPGGIQESAILNEDSSWLLNQDGTKLIIAGQTQFGGSMPARLGLNRLLINEIFPTNVHNFSLTLKYDDDNGTHALTQTQTIRIDNAVDEQSVYLRWIGLTGSWNYYRFVYNQEVSLDVQNATIIKNYVFDWENQDSIEEVIGKSAGQKIKVMAEDLSVADIKGLQSIKYSPKVQMLVNKNPVKWQTIVLNTATFSEYETLNGQAPFSVTFNLPSINIQTQ